MYKVRANVEVVLHKRTEVGENFFWKPYIWLCSICCVADFEIFLTVNPFALCREFLGAFCQIRDLLAARG